MTVVKANDLKNKELIGKSDPYVVVHIRPLFKVKTMVVDDNLNPVWNETFEVIAEDKETQSLIIEVWIFSPHLHLLSMQILSRSANTTKYGVTTRVYIIINTFIILIFIDCGFIPLDSRGCRNPPRVLACVCCLLYSLHYKY